VVVASLLYSFPTLSTRCGTSGVYYAVRLRSADLYDPLSYQLSDALRLSSRCMRDGTAPELPLLLFGVVLPRSEPLEAIRRVGVAPRALEPPPPVLTMGRGRCTTGLLVRL